MRPHGAARISIPALFWLVLAGARGAGAAELRIDPEPAVAGQAVRVTFASEAYACGDEGVLSVHAILGDSIELYLDPPNCPFLAPGYTDYTASTTLAPLAAGSYTLRVFHASTHVEIQSLRIAVTAPPVCAATPDALCLLGRFDVHGTWEDFAGGQGGAKTVPDTAQGLGTSGQLWFFAEENPEIMVKVVDGCAANGRYWVFVSPGSTVKYAITVRDVRTGVSRVFENPKGVAGQLFADTQTFPCS